MTSAIVSSNKSTTVRPKTSSIPVAARALGLGMALLDQASPWLAGALAERLFLSPRAHARPGWEAELVASARRGAVQYGELVLPTYAWGEGPERVLLLHGWEGRGSQLGAFVPALVDAGYQVIAVDLPGHGEATPALTSVVDFGHAIARVVQELGPVSGVIAHSMGAAATALAHTFHAFDARLVLIAAPRSPRAFLDGFMRQFGLSVPTRQQLEGRIARRFGLSVDEVDVARLGAHVGSPALVIHDRDDKLVPFEHGVALVAALPRASLMQTEKLGHQRILRDQRVIEAAVGFIQRSAPLGLAPHAERDTAAA